MGQCPPHIIDFEASFLSERCSKKKGITYVCIYHKSKGLILSLNRGSDYSLLPFFAPVIWRQRKQARNWRIKEKVYWIKPSLLNFKVGRRRNSLIFPFSFLFKLFLHTFHCYHILFLCNISHSIWTSWIVLEQIDFCETI